MSRRRIVVGVVLVGALGGLVTLGLRWWPAARETSCPHGIVPASCPFCDPGLIERLGHCVGHDVPEALCTRCSRALIPAFRAVGDWCEEHGLPESQCVVCAAGDRESTTPEVAISEVGPDGLRAQREPNVSCRTSELRIQLSTPDLADRIGLETARVDVRPVSRTIVATCTSGFDENRHAHLAARAAGVVREVRCDIGERVESGQVLAIVESAELAAVKADFLQSEALVALWEKNHAREAGLAERGIGTVRDLLEAESRLAESRIARARGLRALRSLGVSADAIASLTGDDAESALLTIDAPFAGTIVQRHATIGEVVGTDRQLFAIADTSRMWVLIDVLEADIAQIATGQPVVVEFDGLRGATFGGRISTASSSVDPRTRTLQARAEIANPVGAVRAGMFGRAVITVADRQPSLVVPKAAIQWEGCCNVVFVPAGELTFEPRRVRLGFAFDEFVVVESGVEEGDTVVTTGSYLLKTELLRDSIGAGCCEVQPGAE